MQSPNCSMRRGIGSSCSARPSALLGAVVSSRNPLQAALPWCCGLEADAQAERLGPGPAASAGRFGVDQHRRSGAADRERGRVDSRPRTSRGVPPAVIARHEGAVVGSPVAGRGVEIPPVRFSPLWVLQRQHVCKEPESWETACILLRLHILPPPWVIGLYEQPRGADGQAGRGGADVH